MSESVLRVTFGGPAKIQGANIYEGKMARPQVAG